MLPMGKLYMKEGQKEGVYHPLCRRAKFVLLINDKHNTIVFILMNLLCLFFVE